MLEKACWLHCFKCCLLINCLILVRWLTLALRVCSLPAWNFSEVSLGRSLSPLIFGAGASSALFPQPVPICFLSFRISLNLWSFVVSFKCFLALLSFQTFKNVYSVLIVGPWKGRGGGGYVMCVVGAPSQIPQFSFFPHGLSYFLYVQKLTF